MPHSPLAYLTDIVGCCDAIQVALDGVDIEAYETNRTIRSSVEREFTVIGEAVNALSRLEPALASRISHARMIVGFRNQLVHDYPAILDRAVWAIAQTDVPLLRADASPSSPNCNGRTN